MTEEQYKRAKYLQTELYDVNRELESFKEHEEDDISIGCISKNGGQYFERMRISYGKEYIFKGLKGLLEQYRDYLDGEFKKL